MAITLVVEDGTGLATANTFQSLGDVKTRAEAVGLTFDHASDTDAANKAVVDAAIRIADDYEHKMRGTRLADDQALCYGRTAFTDRYGFALDKETLHTQLLEAHMLLAVAQFVDGDTLLPSAEDPVKVSSRSVSVTGMSKDVDYAEDGAKPDTGTVAKSYPRVAALMAPLLRDSVETVRMP